MNKKIKREFLNQIARGRNFENWERSKWSGEYNQSAEFEAPSKLQGRRGRVDIRLIDIDSSFTVVVELKASNWDKMKPHRIRPNALRHVRQLWRYIEAELSPQDVIPAIVYPEVPQTPGRKEEIEHIMDEHWIQVVWRDNELGISL